MTFSSLLHKSKALVRPQICSLELSNKKKAHFFRKTLGVIINKRPNIGENSQESIGQLQEDKLFVMLTQGCWNWVGKGGKCPLLLLKYHQNCLKTGAFASNFCLLPPSPPPTLWVFTPLLVGKLQQPCDFLVVLCFAEIYTSSYALFEIGLHDRVLMFGA